MGGCRDSLSFHLSHFNRGQPSVDGIISHMKMEIKQLEALDNFDAKLLSNRSLCWLRMGDGQRAYEDATACKKLRPKWAKSHYRQGAALMFLKDYASAYSSLSRALELDPESEEIKKLFWEAMELR